MFSITLYYTYLESFMIKLVATLIAAPSAGFSYFKDMEAVARKRLLRFIAFWFALVVCGVDILVFALVSYENDTYWDVIQSTQGCEGTKLIRSFQYRCLQDMAIMMAGVGMAVGLMGVERPGNLVSKLAYSRCSSKFLGRVLLQLTLSGLPLIVFVNPLWYRIEMEVQWLAVVLWSCQSLAFFLSLFLLV